MRRALLGIGLICVIGGFSSGMVRAQSPPERGRAQFETRAELVLVDVSVTDNNSRPVTDLTPADFDLEVNGQSRPIVAAEYISTLSAATEPPPRTHRRRTTRPPPDGSCSS